MKKQGRSRSMAIWGLLSLLVLSMLVVGYAAYSFTLRDGTHAGGKDIPAAVVTPPFSSADATITTMKQALAEEYAHVTPGTASEEAYRQHYAALLQAIGADPTQHPAMPSTVTPEVYATMLPGTVPPGVNEEDVLAQKRALGQEFIEVIGGSNGSDGYMEHYAHLLQTVVPDATRAAMLLVTPPPNFGWPALPTPLPTGLPAIPYIPLPPTIAPPTPTIEAPDVATVWGPQVPVSRIGVAVGTDKVFVPDTITPDARFLVGTIYPRDLLTPARVVLVDVQSRQVTELRTLTSTLGMVTGAVSDDRWVAWLEAQWQEGDEYIWSLYAYDRTDGTVKRLTGSKPEEEQHCAGCGSAHTILGIAGGKVKWQSSVYGNRPPSSYTTRLTTDLATGETVPLDDSRVTPQPPSNDRIEVRDIDSARLMVWDKVLQQLVVLGPEDSSLGTLSLPMLNGYGLMWMKGAPLRQLIRTSIGEAQGGGIRLPADGEVDVIDTRRLPGK